jgi:hypothetical protein
MASKKITELSSSLVPPLSGVTVVVHSGMTYQTPLSSLRQILVDSGSHTFTGSQNIKGDLVVSGSITAQQYIISSSYTNIQINNLSGSTNFGDTITDTHDITGSFRVTGSLDVIGTTTLQKVMLGDGTFRNPPNNEMLHVESSGSINIARFIGNKNNYTEVYIQNKNSQSLASSDLVIAADNASDILNYIDLGINSSNYSGSFVGVQNDAYLVNVGNDLYIGTIANKPTHLGRVKIFGMDDWENPQIVLDDTTDLKLISFNTGSVSTGYTYEFSGSIKADHNLNVVGSVTASYFIGDGSGLTNLPLDIVGDQTITGSLTITGTTSISNILTLIPMNELPNNSPTGSITVSGSGVDCKPYFWNGNTWTPFF